MIRKSLLALGFAGTMALAMSPQSSMAVTIGPHTPLPGLETNGPVEQVQWGHCRRWARICANRWGWQTRRWYRCMARHGCG
jgi:hypothetical protein